MPLTDKKSIETIMKDGSLRPKLGLSKESVAESSVRDGGKPINSRNNLLAGLLPTDPLLFDVKKARISREKATLSTICQLLKSSQKVSFPKASGKREDPLLTIPKKGDLKVSNKSVSFSQQSCEVTASQITKQYSKAILNTNLN